MAHQGDVEIRVFKLKHKPSKLHPRQKLLLPTENDMWENNITTTSGRMISGPAEITVEWHYSGIDVHVRNLKGK